MSKGQLSKGQLFKTFFKEAFTCEKLAQIDCHNFLLKIPLFIDLLRGKKCEQSSIFPTLHLEQSLLGLTSLQKTTAPWTSVSTPVIVATEATQWETIAVLRKEAAWPGGRIIIDYRGHWVKVMHSFAAILA